jgi:cytochrome b561
VSASVNPERVGSGRYPAIAMLLHWLIAAAIVLQVVLANRMEGPRSPETFAVTQLHKSIGITILVLTLARIGWRLMNPPPPMPTTIAPWERVLAKVTHAGFYVIMIGLPVTGWIMVSSSTFSRPIILYGLVHWPLVPGLADLAPGAKKLWHDVAENGHGLLAKATYVLLALHVAGALKHQLFSRDEPVLARMAPGARSGRWLEPRMLAILLAFVAVIVVGKLMPPPPPGMPAPPTATQPMGPAQEPVEAQAPGEPASRDTTPSPNLSGPAPRP